MLAHVAKNSKIHYVKKSNWRGHILHGFTFDITKKAELDGKQTSGSRELGDQQERTETILEDGGAVYALTCGGHYESYVH